jgi:hypothetical protein
MGAYPQGMLIAMNNSMMQHQQPGPR